MVCQVYIWCQPRCQACHAWIWCTWCIWCHVPCIWCHACYWDVYAVSCMLPCMLYRLSINVYIFRSGFWVICSPPYHMLPRLNFRTQLTRPSTSGWYYPSVPGGSETQPHCVTYRKWWNFSITQATASDSSSIPTYPHCASAKALLAK